MTIKSRRPQIFVIIWTAVIVHLIQAICIIYWPSSDGAIDISSILDWISKDYAPAVLIAENWDKQPEDGFPIPATTLRKRLPAAVMTAIYREHKVYGEAEKDPAVLDGTDGLLEKLKHIFTVEVNNKEHEDMRFTDEQIRQCNALIEKRALSRAALAFVDFVILAERKEKETGEPCRVIVSA